MTHPLTPREKVVALKTNDPTNPAHRLASDLQAGHFAAGESRDDLIEVLSNLPRYAALTEAAACIREMVEWRDIETAPHETLVVLGWFEEGVWKQDLGLASAGQRWPTGSSNMWWHGSATHWIPLPPAPGAEA